MPYTISPDLNVHSRRYLRLKAGRKFDSVKWREKSTGTANGCEIKASLATKQRRRRRGTSEIFDALRIQIAHGQIVVGSIENAFPRKAFND